MATRTSKKTAKLPAIGTAYGPPSPGFTRPDDAIPDMEHTIDLLGAHVVADTIDAYLRAKHRYQVIWGKTGGNNDTNAWDSLSETIRDEAARNVVRAILCWNDPPKCHDDVRNISKLTSMRGLAAGVSYRGVVYAAVPEPDAQHYELGERHPDGSTVMHLVEIAMVPGWEVSRGLEEMTDLDEYFGWNKPAEEPASIFGGRLAAPDDVRLNAPVK